ncbi:MAG: chemotaxis protein CheA [Desulfuromonadaceae bacterium]|nr:chemotaxis protein CheA [Desulfuromonadaceae bacterium]
MDMSLYRDLFVSEAKSHLSAFDELIIHLEEAAGDKEDINELFRHAHSLKGMAATMGYEQIVAIAHLMEDHLGLIRSGEAELLPELTDLLLEGGDLLTTLVTSIESGSEASLDCTPLIAKLTAYTHTDNPDANTTSRKEEEAADLHPDRTTSIHQFRQSDSLNSIRIKTETLDHLVNITGELITNRYRLAESIQLAGATNICNEPLHQLTTLVRSLRDEIFKARMLPFSVIAERFPRLVRDLARKQIKEVHFQIEGKEIELDRGILEEIAEPIVHILRNAVDHGLESADERVMTGKPFGGTLTLTVIRDKDYIEIIISDDGRGMDPVKLKTKGVEKGLITTEQAALMSDQDSFQLVCAPGFSTAETVTDISGRGVGMDAVREVVHGLSGILTIQSEQGKGSSFIMRLPMTVSIIHVMITRSGKFEIAFPLTVVNRTIEKRKSEITDESGRLFTMLEGEQIPVRSMRQALHLPETELTDDILQPMLLCNVHGTLVAFTVDSVSGQQEIFIKPLRSPLSQLRGISGATVTGDGRVLFVADVSEL